MVNEVFDLFEDRSNCQSHIGDTFNEYFVLVFAVLSLS